MRVSSEGRASALFVSLTDGQRVARQVEGAAEVRRARGGAPGEAGVLDPSLVLDVSEQHDGPGVTPTVPRIRVVRTRRSDRDRVALDDRRNAEEVAGRLPSSNA